MNTEVLDFQINNCICEANGCFKNATDKIALRVGTLGTITLFVCRDCVAKFQEVQQT
jgi:hypothetical protein